MKNKVTIDAVRNLISQKYLKYFELIYEDSENIPKSKIEVEESMSHSEYRCLENTLYIRLPDGDIERAFKNQGIGLHRWESDLIHEMIHEYVCKIDFETSEEGINLLVKHPNWFLGNGHDERFYTAIYIIYEKLKNCLNLEFYTLLEEIRSGVRENI